MRQKSDSLLRMSALCLFIKTKSTLKENRNGDVKGHGFAPSCENGCFALYVEFHCNVESTDPLVFMKGSKKQNRKSFRWGRD